MGMHAERCFCDVTVSSIANSFLEKTSLSLPVIITAYAFGYIWSARKHTTDMKKQCEVLERDMKVKKKDNFHLIEEIRRLKCTTSDTMLFKCEAAGKRNGKLHTCSEYIKRLSHTQLDNQSISRKIKRGKSRGSPCSDRIRFREVPMLSLPEMNDCEATKSIECDKLQTCNVEWSPKAESTRLYDDKYSFDFKTDKIGKSDKQSTGKNRCCPDTHTNNDFTIKQSNISSTPATIYDEQTHCNPLRCHSRSKSPNRKKRSPSIDVLSACPKKCKNTYKTKMDSNIRRCLSSDNSYFNSTFKSDLSCPSASNKFVLKTAWNDCGITETNPLSMDCTSRIKEKIHKCKKDITRDLKALPSLLERKNYHRSSPQVKIGCCTTIPTESNERGASKRIKNDTSKCKRDRIKCNNPILNYKYS